MEAILKIISLALSLVFIFIFLGLNAVGTTLSAAIGLNYSGQTILLLVFAVLLLVYTQKRDLWTALGLVKVSPEDIKSSLYYMPLGVMVLANGAFLFDTAKPAREISMIIAFMVCIGFLEEFLFRGMLFRAVEGQSGTKRAVIISGLMFGFGHIVNLLNGYTGAKQIMQIVMACMIGLVLSVLFVRTKSIVPGMAFHFVFNCASALSRDAAPVLNNILVGIIIAVAAAYLAYLVKNRDAE
jgi:membrane protease YdiL (CAAX protease family)